MAVRLFIGNLPYDVTEAELRAHFAASARSLPSLCPWTATPESLAGSPS